MPRSAVRSAGTNFPARPMSITGAGPTPGPVQVRPDPTRRRRGTAMTHTRSNTRKSHWALAAAVAAVPLLAAALPARAQYLTGNDGRARDANNRVGSGGFNDAGPRGPVVTG